MWSERGCIAAVDGQFSIWVLIWETYGYRGQVTSTWDTHTHVIRIGAYSVTKKVKIVAKMQQNTPFSHQKTVHFLERDTAPFPQPVGTPFTMP